VDGHWDQVDSDKGFYHGSPDVLDWWAVDLGGEFAVKRVMWRNRHVDDCCGDRNRQMDVLLGTEAPKNNPISNREKFVLCARWPYKSVLGEISGVTCDCLTSGRHLVIQNGFSEALQIVEVGVYGMKKEDLLVI